MKKERYMYVKETAIIGLCEAQGNMAGGTNISCSGPDNTSPGFETRPVCQK